MLRAGARRSRPLRKQGARKVGLPAVPRAVEVRRVDGPAAPAQGQQHAPAHARSTHAPRCPLPARRVERRAHQLAARCPLVDHRGPLRRPCAHLYSQGGSCQPGGCLPSAQRDNGCRRLVLRDADRLGPLHLCTRVRGGRPPLHAWLLPGRAQPGCGALPASTGAIPRSPLTRVLLPSRAP